MNPYFWTYSPLKLHFSSEVHMPSVIADTLGESRLTSIFGFR